MERPSEAVLQRMPLAEGVLWLWRWVASSTRLEGVWDQHRGRCYQKLLSFALMVRLIAEALLHYGGSGRRSFEKTAANQQLPASIQAAFKKLARLPVAVSQAFLAACTAALGEIFPRASERKLPKSLREFRPCVLDGKAIKQVAKRLRPLRGLKAGLLGGRALVAMDWKTGLAVCMQAHADGEANEVRFVPELMPAVRQHIPGPRLYIADRAFCDLTQPVRFSDVAGDHFVVRYHRKVPFQCDPERPQRSGVDERQRPFTEQWGWLGCETNKKRLYVRRIEVQRAGKESIILVTDLLDADRYLGADLLWLYAERVGIEYLFQEVTEVFGLQGLISSSPAGCIFQFAFCLLLYNMIQAVRAYVAQGQQRKVETISAEKLFDDVKRQMIAWNIMVEEKATLDYFQAEPTLAQMLERLTQLLGQRWCPTWQKAAPQRNRRPSPAPVRGQGPSHTSVYRILQEYQKSKPSGP